MAKDKVVAMVEGLLVADKERLLDLKRSPHRGKFSASFPQYSVALEQEQYDGEFGPDVVTSLSIYDDNAELIDQYTDYQLQSLGLDSAKRLLNTLYESARRQAMGVEAALDTIIAGLPKPRVKKTDNGN